MAQHARLAVPPPDDLRTTVRRAVSFRAFVRETSATVVAVDLTDVSTDGCRFRSPEAFETATIVWLKIPRLGARQARIIWRNGDLYGCEFVAPVQTRSLDDLCAPAAAPRG